VVCPHSPANPSAPYTKSPFTISPLPVLCPESSLQNSSFPCHHHNQLTQSSCVGIISQFYMFKFRKFFLYKRRKFTTPTKGRLGGYSMFHYNSLHWEHQYQFPLLQFRIICFTIAMAVFISTVRLSMYLLV